MMIDPPIGELLEKVDCRYTLAVEAAKRAREIIGGSEPMLESKETKPLSIAIEEINRGLITYSNQKKVMVEEIVPEAETEPIDSLMESLEVDLGDELSK